MSVQAPEIFIFRLKPAADMLNLKVAYSSARRAVNILRTELISIINL
jgi:hypothetical protein